MKKLLKLKLNELSAEELSGSQMKSLVGGLKDCHCSCYWVGQGGSSQNDNCEANYNVGGTTYSYYGNNDNCHMWQYYQG